MLYFAYGSNLHHFQMKRRCKDSIYLKKINLTKFYRVKIKNDVAFAHNSKGSAKLISISESDGLLISKENEKKILKGRKYDFIKF